MEIFLAFQFVFEEMILSLYRNGFLFSFLMIGLVLAGLLLIFFFFFFKIFSHNNFSFLPDSNPDSCERFLLCLNPSSFLSF